MSKKQNSYKDDSRKVFINTFGCQMNDVDSEIMGRLLEREGHRKIDSPEGADAIVPKKNN